MTTNDVLSSTPLEEATTKPAFRFKVWNLLENKDLVMFPRPCKGRIPNFVKCDAAAEKLTSLEVFKKANVVKVNLDKPQEDIRFATLEAGKILLVAVHRLIEGVVMKICPTPNADRRSLRSLCRRVGAYDNGKTITLDEKIHVDLVVLGSVAVSKEGHRVGKGEGFSDLEYAIMAATGLVDETTTVVTTVHDEQVFDTLPHDIFKPFDVHVDFIVTPTQVIEITPRLPKPKGILWDVLSDRRMQLVPLLKTIRDKEIERGEECKLKDVDSEPEDRVKPYYRPPFFARGQQGRRPFVRRVTRPPARPRQRNYSEESRDASRNSRSNSPAPVREPRRRPTRTFRRGGTQRKPADGTGDAEPMTNGHSENRNYRNSRSESKSEGENKENFNPQTRRPRGQTGNFRRGQRRFYQRNRFPVDFSVKVGNIGSSVRVRDLKDALIEKGVRPRDITWKGQRGFALLHFAKIKTEEEKPPVGVDDVIASLQGLTVKNRSNESEAPEAVLSVEPAKPITRIEDAGVTSV